MSPINPPLNQYKAMTEKDWQLSNIEWKEDTSSTYSNGAAQYLIDSTTGKRYLNDSREVVRLKCICPGMIFIPIISAAAGVVNIVYRSGKVLSGYHFWSNKTSEKIYQFTAKMGNVEHIFQARFDDLPFVNGLSSEDIRDWSIKKNEDGTHKFKITNLSGETREINATLVSKNDLMTQEYDTGGKKLKLEQPEQISKKYDIKARCIELAKDIGRIVASIFVVIALTFSALYGLWKPYEARKLISSIALAVCGTNKVAACFAPDPSYHLLGGDINEQNAF